jgi:predicted DNA-binding antitoxin AbrB/MazE fold protein
VRQLQAFPGRRWIRALPVRYNDRKNSYEDTAMTTVLAVYKGGLLRPVQPLPFRDGETVEITVARPKSPASSEEWVQKVQAAPTVQEWAALANDCETTEPEFDVAKAINESRRLTGFRLPNPEPESRRE